MDAILKYFPNLTQIQKEQFAKLDFLYHDWNAKINVISRKDIDELYTKHVLHSLGIAKIIQFEAGTYVLDVGTGGGFPGIPLAILFPETRFYLIDVIAKKIKVVQAVADALELKNGILYLKGGDLTEELGAFPKATEYNLADFFEDEFFETKKVVHLPLKFQP